MSLILRTEKDYGEWRLKLSIKFEYLVSREQLCDLGRQIDNELFFLEDVRDTYDFLRRIDDIIDECKERNYKTLPNCIKDLVINYDYKYIKAKVFVGGVPMRTITVLPE